MIDKFLNKFQEFSENEKINHLSDEVKVSLFSVYLQALKSKQDEQSKPSVQNAPIKSNPRIRRPKRPATDKQKGYIRKLVSQGKLDGNQIDLNNLTVAEASNLIDQGVNARVSTLKQPTQINWSKSENEEEPEGEFTGSYSHSSNGAISQAEFWE